MLRLARKKTPILALVLACALASGLTAPVHAADAKPTTPAATARDYAIPAGRLGDALAQFAATAGVQLVFDPQLLAGLHSTGLQGRYTVREGFSRLLAGSGYELEDAGQGGYALRQRAVELAPVRVFATNASGEAVLPEVSVQATIENGVTEGSDSYTTPVMSTATKLPLSIRETPQSVTVITRQRMDDQGMVTSSDALRQAPGIAITSSGSPHREVYFSRGFDITNLTFDGLPTAQTRLSGSMLQTDLAIYDRVEIVRGSAGLTQGTGTPSAAINFVRKRPTRDTQISVNGHAGRWDNYSLGADVSGSLNSAGTLRGRAVIQGQDSNSFQDVVYDKRQTFYLIGEADLTPNTLLTLSASRQRSDSIMTYGGLPTGKYGEDLKLSRSSFFGSDWFYWDESNTTVFASLEHVFDNEWKLNFSASRIWGKNDFFAGAVYFNDTLNQYRYSGLNVDEEDVRTNYDLNAAGPFHLFGRKHELLLGASRRAADRHIDNAGYWTPAFSIPNVDIYNWDHSAYKPTSVTEDLHGSSNEKQHGFYFTTRLNLADPLKLILGARLDWFKFDSVDNYFNPDQNAWENYTSGYKYDRHLTQYAGLVYDLNKQHSVYASYTDIFTPQNAKDTSNNWIKPIVGKNYEIGAKGEYFGGALNASAALFRIDQENLAMSAGKCLFNPQQDCYRAAGLVRSQGYDLEIQGALSPNWQIGAGYTYVNKRIKKSDNPAEIGANPQTHLPRRQFKLSTTYKLPGGQWRVGGNIRWQNDVYYHRNMGSYDYNTKQNAFTIVDVMAGYKYDQHLDIQLNINNLFDKVYYERINAQPVTWGANTIYGEPRNFVLTARYKF
jgi:outer membrane receptor for ferric coprogen and ferric-rhodotorulic acid